MATNIEKEAIIMDGWLGNQQIMILLNVGENQAAKIRKEIEVEIIKSGKRLTTNATIPVSWLEKYYPVKRKEIFEFADRERMIEKQKMPSTN